MTFRSLVRPLRSVYAVVLRRAATGADRGSTLVVAIMVGAVCLALGTVVVTQSIVTVRDSGHDRQRTGQVHAAESGVDAALAMIQAGQLSCLWPTDGTRASVGDSPDITDVQAIITYKNKAGVSYGGAGCVVPAGVEYTADIVANATSANTVGGGSATVRKMEAEAVVHPPSNGNGYAIYAYGSFSVPNSFNLQSDGVNPADIYTHGQFNCTNSATIQGSVFVSGGGANLSNSCSLTGQLYTRDAVNMTNTASVGKDVTVSQSGLTMSNSSRVYGSARLGGTFSGSPNVSGSIFTNQTIPDPPDKPLPYIGYDPAAWTTGGYAIRDYYSLGATGCTRIQAEIGLVTVPTVFYANCAVNYSGNNSIALKTDVALLLSGGINISNNFNMTSLSGATYKLHIISPAGTTPTAPAGWTTAGCTGGGINMSNQTSFAPEINVFLYSCGSINMSNLTRIYGQIYGKQVNVSNNWTMRFVGTPPPSVNLDGTPSVTNYDIDVLFKRETS